MLSDIHPPGNLLIGNHLGAIHKSIQLLVVDDQSIVRKGICALLEQVDDIDVAGVAVNGKEAVAQAKLLLPDVILMDLVMPQMDGITAIQHILAEQPDMRIVVLTSFVAEGEVYPAIKAGAFGFLLKDSEPDALITAIENMHHGVLSLHQTIAKMVLVELSQPVRLPLTPDPLTEQEVDVIRLAAQGFNNHEIGEHLSIGEATVCTRVGYILNKLHVANRNQGALYILKSGPI